MGEWEEFTIRDFAEILNSKRIPLSSIERESRKGSFPYYGASGIIDYVDDFLFEGEHVLVSEDGENLKSRKTPIAFKAEGKFWVNNHAHILKGYKKHHNDLIIYYLQNLNLNQFLTGAVQPKLNKFSLESIPFYLPKDETSQSSLVQVLSSLDDKIDLLHRQNETLEAMAATLFRQWFVEEAQDDWEWVKVGDFVEVIRGLSYKGAGLSQIGRGIPMHNLNSVHEGGGYKYQGIKYYSGDYKERHFTHPGDLIVTNTEQGHDMLLIGYPAIVPSFFGTMGIFSQHIYKLNITGDSISNLFLYFLLMTHDVREQIAGSTNGSTVNMLPKDGIEWAKFKKPPDKMIQKFTETVSSFWKKRETNYEQIQTLTKLRDTLLPKLMSGEVRVKY